MLSHVNVSMLQRSISLCNCSKPFNTFHWMQQKGQYAEECFLCVILPLLLCCLDLYSVLPLTLHVNRHSFIVRYVICEDMNKLKRLTARFMSEVSGFRAAAAHALSEPAIS